MDLANLNTASRGISRKLEMTIGWSNTSQWADNRFDKIRVGEISYAVESGSLRCRPYEIPVCRP